MEALVVEPQFWRGRRVLVTGHTGFKGAWLSYWLDRMGAIRSGYALPPESSRSLYEALQLSQANEELADVRDFERLRRHVEAFQPDIVFHLAAQSLVRRSYDDPVGTFETNVAGTAAVLNAVRHVSCVSAVVCVASDKCYENLEWPWGYRETDALGGRDPYSASKGASEIVVSSMRRSYFRPYSPEGHQARIASVRAGNVIGGGDWSEDRLIPDIVRECLLGSGVVQLRSPHSVRPWQHVLEPISAYLALAERLSVGSEGADGPFNFGPDAADTRRVGEVAALLIAELGQGRAEVVGDKGEPHEAKMLRLDCSKAQQVLGWRPRTNLDWAIQKTGEWYRRFAAGEDARTITSEQIDQFQAICEGAPPGKDGVCV